MTKRLMELEKESREWKSKWEHSQVALVEASTKYAELGQQAQRLVARNEALEKLCRTLQEERRKGLFLKFWKNIFKRKTLNYNFKFFIFSFFCSHFSRGEWRFLDSGR